jgi:hypothetical protein
MERRNYIFAIIATVIIVGSLSSLFFLVSSKGPSPSPEEVDELDECNVIRYSGEEAINFVFISTEDEAIEYSDFLFDVEPFDARIDDFNIFQVDKGDYKCDKYRGIAILCEPKDVSKIAAACPNDYIIVIEGEAVSIRSSSYQNVMSINSIHPKWVFPHELGHALGRLAEEYVEIGAKLPRDSHNCQEECSNFNEFEGFDSTELDGCFDGCTKSTLKRSVFNGVMRTLQPDPTVGFGNFDELLLNLRIDEELSNLISKITGSIAKITGMAVDERIDASKERYYGIEIEYSEDKGFGKIVRKEVLPGYFGGSGDGTIDYVLKNDEGDEVYVDALNVELYIEGPKEKGSGEIVGERIEVPSDTIFVRAPIGNFESLELRDDLDNEIEINIANAGAWPCIQ